MSKKSVNEQLRILFYEKLDWEANLKEYIRNLISPYRSIAEYYKYSPGFFKLWIDENENEKNKYMEPLINKTGITIKELKDLVKDLPETDEYGGAYEVWVENTDDEGLSNSAKTIMRLNRGDIIISIKA